MTVEPVPLRVLFLTLYPETMPSSRLRVYQYLPALAQCGIRAEVLPAVSEPWFSWFYFSSCRLAKILYTLFEMMSTFQRIRRAREYDVVFVQKGLVSSNLKGFATRLLQKSKRVIFDFDDDVLGCNVLEFRSSVLRAWQDPDQTLKLAKAANPVIAGNEYLRQKIAPVNLRTVVLPTPVDTDRFCPLSRRDITGSAIVPLRPGARTMPLEPGKFQSAIVPLRPGARTMPLEPEKFQSAIVIGWIGMEGGLAYLQSLAPVLLELTRRYPAVRLKVISRVRDGGTFDLSGIKTHFVLWSYDTEVQEMQEFDIGIMPVPQDEWGQGKCGLKLLQYMAMGIASVASRVGANQAIVDEDVDACLASTHDEWVEKLCRLIESPERRDQMGRAARSKVMARYSLKALSPKFVRILKGENDS